ncbi:hypothetical protein FGIG_00719 [Fasciola gigantica]|uniref:Uncharacterized protein n=1 Tax=Fasciola gigantica TaxID=46835 RepID=A0A504Y7E2_FASGI|nr:hypothetical protein FGIG_00719 [Fasciola gigantica]
MQFEQLPQQVPLSKALELNAEPPSISHVASLSSSPVNNCQIAAGSVKTGLIGTLKFGIQTILNESSLVVSQPTTVSVPSPWTPPPPLTLSASISSSPSSSQSPSLSLLPPPPPLIFPLSSPLPRSSGPSSGGVCSPTLEHDAPYDLSLTGNKTTQRAPFTGSPIWPDSTSSYDSMKSTIQSRTFRPLSSVDGLKTMIVDDGSNEADDEDRSSHNSSRLTTNSSSTSTASRVGGPQISPTVPSTTSQMEIKIVTEALKTAYSPIYNFN